MRSIALKKIITLVVAVLLLTTQVQVPVARASGFPVLDSLNWMESILIYIEEALTYVEQYAGTYQQYYEWGQQFALQKLKNSLISKITDQIVGYAQGGIGDSAKFVTNWQSYLSDARITGAQSFSNSLSATSVCSPFRKQLLETMGASGNSGESSGGIDELKCDFTQSQFSAFNADFKNGGWEMYLKTLEPESPNNFNGALLLARQKQEFLITEAEKAASYEALSGNGYLSGKDSKGNITNPGALIKDMVGNATQSQMDLITNANSIQGLISIAASGLIKNLTSSDSGGGDKGLSGVNLRQRARQRNQDDLARRNPDGTNRPPTQAEVKQECEDLFPYVYLEDGVTLDADLDDTALRNTCLETGTAETGNKVKQKSEMVKNTTVFVEMRKTAKKTFPETIKLIRNRLNIFDGDDDGLVDPDNLCYTIAGDGVTHVDRLGQRPKNGTRTAIDTGKILSKSASGNWTSRPCAVQTASDKKNSGQEAPVFDELLPSRNELAGYTDASGTFIPGLQAQNITALAALLDFQKRLDRVKETDDTYTDNGKSDTLPELQDEFNTGALTTDYYDPAAKFCGDQILLYPEFNSTCTKYTFGRAKDEMDLQSVQAPIDPTVITVCTTDSTSPDYDTSDPNCTN